MNIQMGNNMKNIKIGSRDSQLAVTQSLNSLHKLQEIFTEVSFELVKMTSPGDRDKISDFKTSPQNFFTKDLDDSLLNGKIDCAIHSAKDMPKIIEKGIDWFWLPWSEDSRDALVIRNGFELTSESAPVIGVSSERREKFCFEYYPNSKLKHIRGNIEERLQQLDDGKYDIVIIAVAALNRLSLQTRISQIIPSKDLLAPEGQGNLCISFRQGDKYISQMRKLFVRPVVFAGSGPGNAKYATVATVDAIKNCDICLYDALSPIELLDNLSGAAVSKFVGKRSGQHSMNQDEISLMIAKYAKQGKKVVRLKGGDPGIFGRLSEEIDLLESLSLPYKVIPGLSSLSVATTGTGCLLTRRGISRGFTVMTPREAITGDYHFQNISERGEFPLVYFMATAKIKSILESLISEGRSEKEDISIVFSAGSKEQEIITGTFNNIYNKIPQALLGNKPGILIIGKNASEEFLYKQNGVLSNKKILLTCSKTIMKKATRAVENFDGIPIELPLIETKLKDNIENYFLRLVQYDCIVITSPASAKHFIYAIKNYKIDFRTIPKIFVCGLGTEQELIKHNIYPDATVEKNFGAEGMLDIAKDFLQKEWNILRLRSNLAGDDLSKKLTTFVKNIDDIVLYETISVLHNKLPEFDCAYFASASAVKSFKEQFGIEKLKNKAIAVIGEPTKKELEGFDTIKGKEAIVESSIDAIAEYYLNFFIINIYFPS